MTATADRRTDWLKSRKTVITGTDAAKILGFSPFGGAIDVFLDKTNPEIQYEIKTSAPLEAGLRLESTILNWYSDVECSLEMADSYEVIRSPLGLPIGATLDATRIDNGCPVDAKNIRFQRGDWGESGSDEIPMYYAIQLMMQMHVTDRYSADLAVLFSGQDFKTYRLHRDLEVEKEILDRLNYFWDEHVIKGVVPPPDGSKTYGSYLQGKFKQASMFVDTASGETESAAIQLRELQEQIKDLESEKEKLTNIIKAEIADRRGLAGDGWKAIWSQSKDSERVNWEAISTLLATQLAAATGKASGSDIIEELKPANTKISTGSRRFLFTFNG